MATNKKVKVGKTVGVWVTKEEAMRLEESAKSNGRTVGGEIRFRLAKLRATAAVK